MSLDFKVKQNKSNVDGYVQMKCAKYWIKIRERVIYEKY